jgi:hypothetical protein
MQAEHCRLAYLKPTVRLVYCRLSVKQQFRVRRPYGTKHVLSSSLKFENLITGYRLDNELTIEQDFRLQNYDQYYIYSVRALVLVGKAKGSQHAYIIATVVTIQDLASGGDLSLKLGGTIFGALTPKNFFQRPPKICYLGGCILLLTICLASYCLHNAAYSTSTICEKGRTYMHAFPYPPFPSPHAHTPSSPPSPLYFLPLPSQPLPSFPLLSLSPFNGGPGYNPGKNF